MLARVSIVNSHGHVVYDSFVAPQEKVVDYRTPVSGIKPANLKNAPDFKTVQLEVSKLLRGKILVGHALKNDLTVLLLDHPHKDIRDTAKYKPFQETAKSKRPALRKLAKQILNITIQEGEHSSVSTILSIYHLFASINETIQPLVCVSQFKSLASPVLKQHCKLLLELRRHEVKLLKMLPN